MVACEWEEWKKGRATDLGEVLCERSEARSVERARAERKFVGLLGQRLDDVRVAVALVDGAAGRYRPVRLGEIGADGLAKGRKGPAERGGYADQMMTYE